MKEFNADLHLHGPYSTGVSKNMLLPIISEQAHLKGLGLMHTSDILQGTWFEHVKQNLIEESNGIFIEKEYKTPFIVGTEVQCNKRVHHVIFLPDLESALELKGKMKGAAIFDSWGCGRPVIRLSAEEIAKKVEEVGGMIGPAHAFTPYFSVYAHFNSLKELYGEMQEKISFIELGLSADSYFADLIEENHQYSFLTNSDAHSPWPHRIGREFNRMKLKEPSFAELKKALEDRSGERITLNVGLNPQEGKYHLTACNSCYVKYTYDEAEKLGWSCSKCKGAIKKGVRERIIELADFEEETHPKFRPPYLHSLPLAEIIQVALDMKMINSVKVQSLWKDYVERFGNEIKVLVDAKVSELKELNPAVGKKIESFRKGFVVYSPGGGGNYGTPFICDSKEELQKKKIEIEKEIKGGLGQKTLGEF